MAEAKKENRFAKFFKEVWFFISSKQFLKSFGYMVGVAVIAFLFIFQCGFPTYTRHGEEIETPDICNLTIDQAKKLMKSRKLRLIVTDSLYEPQKEPGVVLDQNPKAGDKVKPNRTIYVTVNTSMPPLVNIYYKQIIGRPLSFVERKFKSIDVKLGELKYIPGKGENTIAKAFIDDRVLFIEANPSKGETPPSEPQRIPRGTTINLHLYRGEDAELKVVPKVQCLTYQAALFVIKGSEYHKGNVVLDNSVGTDTLGAYVWRQSPPPISRASMGSGIDIWLTKEQPEACREPEDEDND